MFVSGLFKITEPKIVYSIEWRCQSIPLSNIHGIISILTFSNSCEVKDHFLRGFCRFIASKMHNQGSDQDKVDESASPPYYPPPDAQMPPMAPGYPAPQPSTYPPQQPGPLTYPSAPVQQQPTSMMTNTNTTVLIQQQPAAVVVQVARGWSSGVCACFDDCGVCKSGEGTVGERG